MHLVPVTPPAHVRVFSGFDYVTVDASRRRIYAAHSGSRALLVVNADDGSVVGQVRVGPMHGVAVDPDNGHVYTGDGDSDTISEVDPVALKVLQTAQVGGAIDAIAYDPVLHRVYADEDDGTHVYVVDTQSMKQIASVVVPGHKPEYLAIDPETHELYQNIDGMSEVAVIDPRSLTVSRVIKTPEVQENHPLRYDSDYHALMVGGENGLIATYDRTGKLLGKTAIQQGVDQCDYDQSSRELACAGSGQVSVLKLAADGTMSVLGTGPVAQGVHTCAIDPTTGHIFVVWSDETGDFVQPLALTP